MNWLAAMADSPDGEGCEPPSTVAANDIERDTCGKADRCGAEVTEIFARSRGNRNRSAAQSIENDIERTSSNDDDHHWNP
jgi:hypothetical protein